MTTHLLHTSSNHNNNLQKAPPIDLNALHTPHKLAAFVVNVPRKKQEYSFLFNDETTTNNNNISHMNKSSLQTSAIQTSKSNILLNRNNTQYLSVNSLSVPNKSRKSKSSNKKTSKRKQKI